MAEKNLKKRLLATDGAAQIPLKWVGPIKVTGFCSDNISVPLATYESPLWPSVARGAKISQHTDGISVVVESDVMTRSFTLEASSAVKAVELKESVIKEVDFKSLISETSSHAQFKEIDAEIVGKLLYFRLAIFPADASGHNMVTKAANHICNYILKEFSELKYVSISGNACTDKKVSAVNSIKGRGRKAIAEIVIPKKICNKFLRVEPQEIVDINNKKNLMGSILAGSLRSANAHYANILLAFYLATGQDAANIVEGSQGITYASTEGEDLYFSVTIPNIIVGTVGNGKDIGFVKDNLEQLGCLEDRPAGENSKRLAALIASAVLCSELSLLAALCNTNELVDTHMKLERE